MSERSELYVTVGRPPRTGGRSTVAPSRGDGPARRSAWEVER